MLRYVRTQKNSHEVEIAHDLFSSILDHRIDYFEDSLAMEWGDSPTEYDNFFYFNKTSIGKFKPGCPLAEPVMVVHTDGAVASCCWDYNLTVSGGGFGNAHDHQVLDIWRGEKRVQFLKDHRKEDTAPKKCKDCIWSRELSNIDDGMLKIEQDYMIDKSVTAARYRLKPAN